ADPGVPDHPVRQGILARVDPMDARAIGRRKVHQSGRFRPVPADGRSTGSGGHDSGLPSASGSPGSGAARVFVMYAVTQLENGLTVATAEMPHMTSVSVGIWVGVGSRYEPAPLNGTCHFIEHLLFKGTRNRSAREISQAVEGAGGYLNAFT